MSQVDSLFEEMGGAATMSVDPSTEPHIVIGGDRFIIVPPELQRIAVQRDHNAETVTWDCPRYWDGTDMSQMTVCIVTTLENGEKVPYHITPDAITIDDIDDSIMHFDWRIKSNITAVPGKLTVSVCITNAEADPDAEASAPLIETFHWNTEKNKEMYVSEGQEIESTDIPSITDPTADSVAALVEQNRTLVSTMEGLVNQTGDVVETVGAARDEAEAAADRAEAARDEANGLALLNEIIIPGEGTGSVRMKSAVTAGGTNSVAFGDGTSTGNASVFTTQAFKVTQATSSTCFITITDEERTHYTEGDSPWIYEGMSVSIIVNDVIYDGYDTGITFGGFVDPNEISLNNFSKTFEPTTDEVYICFTNEPSIGNVTYSKVTQAATTGNGAFASGINASAEADASTSLGNGTTANVEGQFVAGMFNAEEEIVNNVKPLFVIGNGTSDSNRNNAFVVYDDGTISINGIKVGYGGSY